jgi:hypothetical protein
VHTLASPVDVDTLTALQRLAHYRKGVALVPVGVLGEVLELPQEDALDLAAELESSGWLETWDEKGLDSPCVILSSLAADRLDLELWPPDDNHVENCRWFKRGHAPQTPRGKTRSVVGTLETDLYKEREDGTTLTLDSLADPNAVDPAKAVATIGESLATPSATRAHWGTSGTTFVPGPLILVGLRNQWAGPLHKGDVCPGCGGRKLPSRWYCVECDGCAVTEDDVRTVAPDYSRMPDLFLPPAERKARRAAEKLKAKSTPKVSELKAKPAAPFLDPAEGKRATSRKAKRSAARRKGEVKVRGNSFDLATLKATLP